MRDASAADALDWEVEWAPVIELHHYVWDGDPQGETYRGLRGLA